MGNVTFATLTDYVPPGVYPCRQEGSETGDLWYWLTGNGKEITVKLCGYGDPSWDSVLAVYTGGCGEGNISDPVVCDDDGCVDEDGTWLSKATFNSTLGEIYLIRVLGWTYSGVPPIDFHLTVTTVPGACCRGETCTIEPQETCTDGVYQGDYTDCFPNPCRPPVDFWYDSVGDQGGNGWPDGTGSWLTYPSTWVNQWWINEFNLAFQKRVVLRFWVDFAGPPPLVAVNYTDQTYTETANPPYDDPPIVRVPVDPPVTAPGYYEFTTLIEFCPRWVSVDVMYMGGDFRIEGTIEHICLTGPTTGACCVGIECTDNVSATDCAAMAGIYMGDGSVCDPVPTACYGDADCSHAIDFDDINYFVAALAGGESGWTNYYKSKHGGALPPCTFWNCDANGSGRCADPQAAEVDFDDINPFVAKLVTPPDCP
jgi:hypothetical protein